MKEIKNVPGLNPEDKVVIKKYSYGEQAKLASKIAKVSLSSIRSGKGLDGEPDLFAAQIYPLVYGIMKAPFFTHGMSESDKVAAIEALDGETGKHLIEAVREYNSMENNAELEKK